MESDGQGETLAAPGFWAESGGRGNSGCARDRAVDRFPRRSGDFLPWAESDMPWAGPRKLQTVFILCLLIPEACLICFCPNFGQISSSFFLNKIIQRNFVLGNRKVTEMLLKSIKLMEFYFMIFPLQIEKCAPFKFKRSKELKMRIKI